MTNVAKLEQPPKRKLLQQLADRYGVEPEIFRRTVSAVAMPSPHTDEELISCLIVANEHDLNPLTKEIHFMRDKTGRIHPIVGVDGWVKKLNTHPQFDGFDFEHERDKDGKLLAVTCRVYRKDRAHPVVATELLSECIRLPGAGKGPNAWSMTPSRMLRHRALMQATRYAVGFAGAMDQDEFERWQEMKDITPRAPAPQLSDLPDIPDQPALAPAAEAEPQTPAVVTTRTDAEFQSALEASFATAKDLDALNEHYEMNADEIAERGLQQWARDKYEDRKGRLY